MILWRFKGTLADQRPKEANRGQRHELLRRTLYFGGKHSETINCRQADDQQQYKWNDLLGILNEPNPKFMSCQNNGAQKI